MNFQKIKSGIMLKAFLNENGRTKITVKIDDPPSQVLVDLNVNDNLSNIREELRKNDMIEMNDALSFAKKETDGLSEIGVDEKSINLDDILDGNVLHLIKSSKCNWKFLNSKFHLEYGLSITPDGIKKAKKKAFTIKDWKDCKMTKIGAKGCQKGTFEFNSNEYWGMKSNLLFSGNINVRDLVNLGVSVGKLQNNNVNVEMNSTYSYREFGKVSLEFSKCLEPTSDFINIVEKAIESGDPNKLKQIIEEYGQFIPDEVILGGRFYFEGTQTSKKLNEENDYESVVKVGIQQALDIGVGNRSENSKGNTNSCKRECTKLIGGEQPDSLEEFDETAWVRSLKDFRNWDCIEYKNPISIFQILPNDSRDLHGRIFSLIGKKIHYSRIEDFTYNLKEFEKPKVLKLDIPPKISKIVQNKKTDCNIFATVLDTDENDDFFNYQIFHPPKGNPNLIIHCIQNKLRKRECKLKIGWMIVGYHTDFSSIFTDSNIQLKVLESDFNASKQSMDDKKFLNFEYNSLIEKIPCLGIPVLSEFNSSNESIVIGHHFFNVKENNKLGSYTFSYCLNHNHYVNLPDFTFYTLIISKYSNPDDYGMESFTKNNFKDKISSFINNSFNAKMIKSKFSKSDSQMKLKYVSLHSSGENNCGPIFLKQKSEKIKSYTINISCGQASSCICKNKTLKKSKKNLEYAFFTPKEENKDETEA